MVRKDIIEKLGNYDKVILDMANSRKRAKMIARGIWTVVIIFIGLSMVGYLILPFLA